MGKSLGIILTIPSGHSHFGMAVIEASQACKIGVDVYLYCLDEAVLCINSIELQTLRNQGLKLYGCAFAARKHHLPLNDLAVFCGLSTLSDLLAGVDQCSYYGTAPVSIMNTPSADKLLPMIIVWIESNPSESDRPLEALRIAAGLSVWQKLEVVLLLSNCGCLLLNWRELEFEHSELYDEYFKILSENSVSIYLLRNYLPVDEGSIQLNSNIGDKPASDECFTKGPMEFQSNEFNTGSAMTQLGIKRISESMEEQLISKAHCIFRF